MRFQRQTLAKEVRFEGIGLHSADPVVMTLRPHEGGIVFSHNGVETVAHPANVTETTRCTTLGNVNTVEHIMSALAALEITDAHVELTAAEVPGMDGSAKPFLDELQKAGLTQLGETELAELYARVFLQEDDIKIAVGKGSGHWRFEYETGTRWPHSMIFDCENTLQDYGQEIASARTFALSEEVPRIIEMGLGKGLDATSALVLGVEGFKNEPRFPDEPARHKLLDLIGDLYLAGVPLRFLNVVGHRSGHRSNVKAAALLAKAVGR